MKKKSQHELIINHDQLIVSAFEKTGVKALDQKKKNERNEYMRDFRISMNFMCESRMRRESDCEM